MNQTADIPIAYPGRRRPLRSRRPIVVAAATVAAGALIAAGSVWAVGAAQAATVDTGASYVLVSVHSGKAVDVYNRSTADGAQIVQWARNDGAWQQWQFVDSGDGFYRVRSRHSGLVLTLASTADGAALTQRADTNAAAQQFRLADSDGGTVRLINRASNKALDVWEWSTADGGRVSQYTDHGGANQQWQLVRLDGGAPTAGPTGGPTTPAPGQTTPPPSGPTTPPSSYPNPGPVSGSTGVHDPEPTKTANGTYLLASTGNNIPLKTSTDRVAWRAAGNAFSGSPTWAHPYTNGSNNLWAPDITYVNGRYYMYYSASTFGSQNSAIFLATSTTGAAGSFTHQGLVISSSGSVNYNAIDPNLYIDQSGQWWLTFGSFWSGIKMIRLDPNTGLRSGSELHSLASYSNGIEAPTLIRRGGFYYLFVSFDRCCQGTNSTYRIMVGRSTSLTGPYTDRDGRAMTSGGGTQILARHGNVIGPGHQAVLEDNDGHVLFYHYYTNSGSLLGINRLGWDSAGWPFVY